MWRFSFCHCVSAWWDYQIKLNPLWLPWFSSRGHTDVVVICFSKIYTALKDTSEKPIQNKLKYVLFPKVASIVTSIYVSMLMLKRQTNRNKQN